MAKESMKAREVKRAKLVAKFAAKREKYLSEGDYDALQTIPKNASPVRLHNRCKLTGQPQRLHASVRYFTHSVRAKWLQKA